MVILKITIVDSRMDHKRSEEGSEIFLFDLKMIDLAIVMAKMYWHHIKIDSDDLYGNQT